MSEIFQKGARVIGLPSAADGYVQPYRGWFQSGRVGTVVGRTPDRNGKGNPVVQFDTKRKPKHAADYRVVLRDCDLLEAKDTP